MSRRAVHAADTRQALISEARRLIAEHGYRDMVLSDVCAAAGVTKGALYHHFASKEDLFLAVLNDVEQDFIRAGMSAAEAGEQTWDLVRTGCQAFLDQCIERNTGRILNEATAAVGWERAHEVEGRYVGILAATLGAAAAEGVITTESPEILARLLFAIFGEAAAIIAGAVDSKSARRDVGREVDVVLESLRMRAS